MQGNRIGTALDGSPLGNSSFGVRIDHADDNVIGGTDPRRRQRDCLQHGPGVVVHGKLSTGNRIQQNSLHDNTAPGIDLARDGVTANDADDGDTGPNNRQNFAEVTTAVLDNDDLTISYLVSSSVANSAYDLTIEFFLADAAGQEGALFLGSDTYLAAEAGTLQTAAPLDVSGLGIGVNDLLVTTATDAAGNSSEFSAAVLVSAPLTAAATAEGEATGDS